MIQLVDCSPIFMIKICLVSRAMSVKQSIGKKGLKSNTRLERTRDERSFGELRWEPLKLNGGGPERSDVVSETRGHRPCSAKRRRPHRHSLSRGQGALTI